MLGKINPIPVHGTGQVAVLIIPIATGLGHGIEHIGKITRVIGAGTPRSTSQGKGWGIWAINSTGRRHMAHKIDIACCATAFI